MPSTKVWLPVVGYEGRYEVSDRGDVRSLLTNRILKQMIDKKGYPRVSLYGVNTKKTLRVHLLVLEAFVGARPNADVEGCHYDDDKSNNQVDNLRWGTRSDNAHDRIRNGLHNMARKTHCPNNHPYDEENTCVSRGRRECRTCIRDRARIRRAA